MKNTLRLLLALLPVITFIPATAQTVNPLFHHIPADADQVYHIDLKTLGPKLDWATLASLLNGRNIGKNKLPFDIMSLMNSGCDFRADVVVARSNLNRIDSISYTTILIHLTDSGKFAAFLHTTAHDLHFQHLPGHERVAVDNKNSAYAWNDKIAVIQMAKLPKTSDATAPSDRYLARKCVAALHGPATSYFTTDTRFTTTFSNDGDMQFWNRHAGNMGGLTKMVQGSPGGVPLNGLAQLAAKTTTGPAFGTLRFEPGNISYRSLRVLSPTESSNLKHIAGQGLSSDVVAAVPPGKLLGLAGVHYDISSILDSLTGKMPADSLTKMLGKLGFSLQDISHALKGDILFLAYDPGKSPDGTPSKKPGFYIMLSLADPSAFARITSGLKLGDAATFTRSQTIDSTHHGAFSWYATHNGMAVVGGSPLEVATFFDHSSTGASPAGRLLIQRSRTDIFYLGIDMHAAANFLTSVLMKGDTIATKDQALVDALRQMDALLVSSGGTKDDTMEADFELRMTNKDKNSLATLLDIVGKLSAKPGGNPGQ